mmetsp:Transcript_5143/g.7236  ORF Transcript_5143/g.7236 Transcript_5143/m.7236 type:complete len:321 (+) Transcript_5143:182-1144(+)
MNKAQSSRKRSADTSLAVASKTIKKTRIGLRQSSPNSTNSATLLSDPVFDGVVEFLDFAEITKLRQVCKRLYSFCTLPRIRNQVLFTRTFWKDSKAPDIQTMQKILVPYVRVGNPQATHFLGMILYYCQGKLSQGVKLLLTAASIGNLNAAYDAALILRKKKEGLCRRILLKAASNGHAPSCVELGNLDERFDDRKVNPCEEFEKEQQSPIYQYLKDFQRQSHMSASGFTCVNECGRHLPFHSQPKATSNDSSHTHHIRITLRNCARCFQAKYCSRLCQMVSWQKGHRNLCSPTNVRPLPVRPFLARRSIRLPPPAVGRQ